MSFPPFLIRTVVRFLYYSTNRRMLLSIKHTETPKYTAFFVQPVVCGTASTGAASSSTTDVAFVTDVGNIDDQSFNQYTWAGVQQFCDANGLNANYYKPSEDSDAARVEQMDNAVKDGAKVIVMAGYLFAPALEEAQAKYPDISFLALDVSTGDLAEPAANTALTIQL